MRKRLAELSLRGRRVLYLIKTSASSAAMRQTCRQPFERTSPRTGGISRVCLAAWRQT